MTTPTTQSRAILTSIITRILEEAHSGNTQISSAAVADEIIATLEPKDNPNGCAQSICSDQYQAPTDAQQLISLHQHLVAEQEEGSAFATIARQRLDRLIEAQQTIATLREDMEKRLKHLDGILNREIEKRETIQRWAAVMAEDRRWAGNVFMGPVPTGVAGIMPQDFLLWIAGRKSATAKSYLERTAPIETAKQ